MFINIHDEIAGREIELLHALGIFQPDGNKHIRCPYPDHEDKNPSWRWIYESRKAVCTCSKPHSIIDVIIKIGQARNFIEAVAWVRYVLGIESIPTARLWSV